MEQGKGLIPLLSLTIYGQPAPAGSKRAFRGIVVDANPRSRPWKNMVSQHAGIAWAGKALLAEGVHVTMRFYRPRPKSHYRAGGTLKAAIPPWPLGPPDVLKLGRGVEDALTGVVMADDRYIVSELLEKHYGEPARVEIEIFRAGERSEGIQAGVVPDVGALPFVDYQIDATIFSPTVPASRREPTR